MNDAHVLRTFVDQHCVRVPGGRADLTALVVAFVESLPLSDRPEWPRRRIVAALDAAGIAHGRSGAGRQFLVNIVLPDHKLSVVDGVLVRDSL